MGKSVASGVFSQALPLAVDVVEVSGAARHLAGGYQSVRKTSGGLECAGTLKTPSGTQFQISDTYRALPSKGAFTLSRTVRIRMPSPADSGFNSQFSLEPEAPTRLTDCDCFVPGVWYKQNAHVPPGALAGSLTDRAYLFREDRLPLPLAALRNRRTGVTLMLAHLGGVPATAAGDQGPGRVVDARMQFGSLGFFNNPRPSPAFMFPGTEGERTYLGGASGNSVPSPNRWAYRCHPVAVGVPHSYRLLIALSQTPGFPAAVRRCWRLAYALAAPQAVPANLPKVYADQIRLLSKVTRLYDGVISVPFEVSVPAGKVVDASSQMGFVGQALPCAALLLRGSLQAGDTDAARRAVQVVNFWAAHAMTPAGMPRAWYDPHPGGTFTWRTDPLFLRIASDGMDGALHAWSVLHLRGISRPDWLLFCRRYGDWLVSAQAADGSWARKYGFDGRPLDPATDTTDQAIPFLADLYFATGDGKYKSAALRAGAYCWKSVHREYAYVGGTPDNPNVLDKEGGMEALAAFLALHDLTGQRRWLLAAAQAADYCETWVYCWNIPMPPGDPKVIFPQSRTTLGLSLIAAGQSACDDFMAAAPFEFYELSLLTGDAHERDAAEMLLQNTKQITDWDGTLGYAQPGLLTEALTLSPSRGHGIPDWLPWLTVCLLQPMADLQQTFGTLDLARINRLPRVERLRRLAAYCRTRGF